MEECLNVKSLYFLKDKKLNDVVGAFLLKDHEVSQHFSELANDVRSPFYKRQEDFVIYCAGVVSDDDFSIIPESGSLPFSLLSEYIDVNRINYQWMVQTLNYLPTGYFKMPKEKQEEVEKDIRRFTYDYPRGFNHYIRRSLFYKTKNQ